MTQIRLENVSFGYSEPLFSDVTITIADEHRLGIVGNNGAGKSSLLKCITGELEPSSGQIIRPKSVRFGIVEQDLPSELLEMPLRDMIAEAISEAVRDYESWKVDIALDAFETPEDLRTRPMKDLSGGWRRLALIIRAQVSDPDVLILDEPTNHLDLEKIVALEAWLNGLTDRIPLLIVSHDRTFLENCTNQTLFVRPTRSRSYPCSYSKARSLLMNDDRTANTQREKELEEIRRLEKSAHTLREIGKNNYSDDAALKAKQISERARKIKENLTDVAVERRREIQLNSSHLKRKWLVRMEDVDVRSPTGDVLFHVDKLDIGPNERVILNGHNGAGKSTFLQMLRKAFADPEGAKKNGIQIAQQADLGYLDQHLSDLPLKKTLRQFVSELGVSDQVATAKLVDAGFPYRDQKRPIGVLSHGERSRLYLLALQIMRPNFYLLDEPTNHLDIEGQEKLEAAMLEDGASCVLVSHDRSFMEAVGTTTLTIRKNNLIV